MAKKINKTGKADNKKKLYIDSYYMSINDITTRDLYQIISTVPKVKAEFWEAADVIEIELDEKASIDIEKLSLFKGEDDKKFLDEYGVKNIYAIKTDDLHKDIMLKIFKEVVAEMGGFVCSDSDDFMPFYIK